MAKKSSWPENLYATKHEVDFNEAFSSIDIEEVDYKVGTKIAVFKRVGFKVVKKVDGILTAVDVKEKK